MKSKIALVLFSVLLLLFLSACGASSGNSYSSSAPGAAASDSAYYYDEAPAAYETESAVWQNASPEEGTSGRTGNQPEGAKRIYTANISMETTEFDDATNRLSTLVNELGGYFETSEVDNSSYNRYRTGYYVIRIPAENFSGFCEQAGSICQVLTISRSEQDVSEIYYDNEARLSTAQTKLERLQELLAEAENMEDIITLESAISETEYEIESLTGTLRHYDSLINYSTITIFLNERAEISSVEEPPIGFGAQLSAAFAGGNNSLVNGTKRFLLSLARNWPAYAFLLIVLVVVLVIVLRKVKKAKKAASAPVYGAARTGYEDRNGTVGAPHPTVSTGSEESASANTENMSS